MLTLYASIIRLITLLEFADNVPTADFGMRFFNSCGRPKKKKKEKKTTTTTTLKNVLGSEPQDGDRYKTLQSRTD